MDFMQIGDVEFLKRLAARYPELHLLTTPAHASPEGSAVLRPDALSYQVFGTGADPASIEAERTLVALLSLKWILEDKYELFTISQPAGRKLSRISFDRLKAYTVKIWEGLKNPDLCFYAIACNDLGKTKQMEKEYFEIFGQHADDHDMLYSGLVGRKPELFPAFQRFNDGDKKLYLDGLRSDFNLGQFIQGENLPCHLKHIQNTDSPARDLRLLCEIYDIAGSKGHIDPNGARAMTEDVAQYVFMAIDALASPSPQEAYRAYMKAYAQKTGLQMDSAEDFAIARLSAQARIHTPEQAKILIKAWKDISPQDRDLLAAELNHTGLDRQKAILLYYAPAYISNTVHTAGDLYKGLMRALSRLADIFRQVRVSCLTEGPGAMTIDLREKARGEMTMRPVQVNGNRLAFVGIGGGSDCIQAAIMALLSGKPACAISIRTEKPSSQDGKGHTDQKRNVANHGGIIAPDVYMITPDTTGSGRFLEFIPAGKLPVYLVIDKGDGRLSAQIASAISHFDADSIVAVDTGGDCLYKNSINDASKATPDQDIASLHAIHQIEGKNLFSCVIANGVDAPDYAADVLRDAQAGYFTFSPDEQEIILDLYREFRMDGSDPKRYGKTPFAWQAALKGQRGNVRLPLPDAVVNDPVNPWNPNVIVTDEMAGFYLMDLAAHIRAISS